MAINFPNTPSDGDTHAVGDVTFTYNGTKLMWSSEVIVDPISFNLSDIVNVNSITPTQGQILSYDVSTSKWINTDAIDAYTKTEVDTALTNKSDTTHTHDLSAYDTSTQVDTKIAAIPDTDLSAYDTSTQVDTKIAAIPATDLSAYDTSAQVDTKVASIVDSAPSTLDTLNELAAALGDDPNHVTTMTTLVGTKADQSTTYTKTEVDTSLNLKSDKTTTYTKTEVDTSLNLKSDKTTTYTKTEVDTSLNLKSDKTTTYTKTEVDTALTNKSDTTHTHDYAPTVHTHDLSSYDTSAQVDTKLLTKSDTTHNHNTTYYTKTEVDTAINSISDSSSVSVSDTAPANAVSGDLWVNSNNMKLYVYYVDTDSSQWVEIVSAATSAALLNWTEINGNLIPNIDNMYDIGSPDAVVRDMYISESSLWIGDRHKLEIDSSGKMKVRKRDVNVVPLAVITAGGNEAGALSDAGVSSLSDMKMKHWVNYIKVLTGDSQATVKDVFNLDNPEESESEVSLDNEDVYSKIEVDTAISSIPPPTVSDIQDINLNVQPEVLEIQVDFPEHGHGTNWKWTWEQSSLPYSRIPITNETQLVVPLYMQGSYIINNFAYSLHDSMTQTHSFHMKWIESSGTDNLIDWTTITTETHSHPDINDGDDILVEELTINVPDNILLPTLTLPNGTYDVTHTSGAYSFTGTMLGDNPEIGPFYRGGTYTINIDAVGHPFYFTTDNGTSFVTNSYVGEWTVGVTGSRTDSGVITFIVPETAPDILYYQCGNHSIMRGNIRVKSLEVETNENGNYIVYGQHDQDGHSQKIELRPLPQLTSQMCLVYDATTGTFVPQDLSTYVDNTPIFKNKIKEVAGTATLVAPDGTSLVASVEIYTTESYLPQVNNTIGDIAFAQDTQKLYIWDGGVWIQAAASIDLSDYDTSSEVDTKISNVSGVTSLTTTLTQSGDLILINGTERWYADRILTIFKIKAYVSISPVGSNLNIRINKTSNGETTYTDVLILDDSLKTTISTTINMLEDDFLTVDITQIGSSISGSDLNLIMTYS